PLSLAYLPGQQRFDPLAANSLFANQNYLTAGFPLPILPFTLPVAANFKYGHAQQGNLTIEHQISKSWKMSVGYQYTKGLHLNRPVDINSTDPKLLAQNAFNAAASGLSVSDLVTVVVATGARYPAGFGVPVPFNSVDAQLSDSSSWYHALTVDVQKRFCRGFMLFSSYTWSHSIDDGTDLQSTLEPQDSRFPFFERSNSVNDQRHRWVTSAIFQTATAKGGDGAWKHLAGGFTVAQIIEVSSGRPFNVITGTDTLFDLGSSQAPPSLASPRPPAPYP